MASLPEQEAHVREILARSRVEDWDALRLTTCYAADRCQGDLGCPFLVSCQSAGAEPDDDYDDERW